MSLHRLNICTHNISCSLVVSRRIFIMLIFSLSYKIFLSFSNMSHKSCKHKLLIFLHYNKYLKGSHTCIFLQICIRPNRTIWHPDCVQKSNVNYPKNIEVILCIHCTFSYKTYMHVTEKEIAQHLYIYNQWYLHS